MNLLTPAEKRKHKLKALETQLAQFVSSSIIHFGEGLALSCPQIVPRKVPRNEKKSPLSALQLVREGIERGFSLNLFSKK